MRWLFWPLLLWNLQALAKPAMKAEPLDAKLIKPSSLCAEGPFEVSFTTIEARFGQQVKIHLESVANGASFNYRIEAEPLPAGYRTGSITLPSTPNSVDPCAPSNAQPQETNVTIAPKPQQVAPGVKVIPPTVGVTVVTPPPMAGAVSKDYTLSLSDLPPNTPFKVVLWGSAARPVALYSMTVSLEQIVPEDPAAYAAWEAKQAQKAEAQAQRQAKRAAKKEARIAARQIKVAQKNEERQAKAIVRADAKAKAQAEAQVEYSVKLEAKAKKEREQQIKLTAKAEKREAKLARREARATPRREKKEAELVARLQRRAERRESREVKIQLKEEKKAPIRAAKIARKERKHEARLVLRAERRQRKQLKIDTRIEQREARRIPKRQKREAKLVIRLEKRTERRQLREVKVARKEKERAAKLEIKRKERLVKIEQKKIAQDPKIVARSLKKWDRFLARDQKRAEKIAELKPKKQYKKPQLENRRYNLMVMKTESIKRTYEELYTDAAKAEFKVELYDEAMALRADRDAEYNLIVEARVQEQERTNAAASLETPPQAGATVAVNAPPAPAPRTEVRGPAPAQDATWQAGYWQWTGTEYIWIQGHWVVAQIKVPSVKITVQKDKPAQKSKPYSSSNNK